MAGSIVNTFTNTDNSDVDNIEVCVTDLFKGFDALSLTNMDNTTVPAISAGSLIEVNGSLISFAVEEAISTIDPATASTVADGVVYVIIDGTNRLAYLTATAPTWSDSKQGWYGTTTLANWKYLSFVMTKATASYSAKLKLFDYSLVSGVNYTGDITSSDITATTITASTIVPLAITGNITLFSEIAKLYLFEVHAETSGTYSFDFPSGYTIDNCMVLGVKVRQRTTDDRFHLGTTQGGESVSAHFDKSDNKVVVGWDVLSSGIYQIDVILAKF